MLPRLLNRTNLNFDFRAINNLNQGLNGPTTVANASYRVVPLPYEAPTFMPGAYPGTAPGNSTVVNNPWTAASANATTLNWHSTDAATDFNYTRGNNNWAYFDIPNTNTPDAVRASTSTTPLPTLTFIYGNAPDYNDPVTNTDNQKFNVTNLFYYNNIIHDVLYAYGFDEPGGNFQSNNLGRGGNEMTMYLPKHRMQAVQIMQTLLRRLMDKIRGCKCIYGHRQQLGVMAMWTELLPTNLVMG